MLVCSIWLWIENMLWIFECCSNCVFGETCETRKHHILVKFELWYKCRYSIQYSFQRGIRWFNQIFSILNNYVTVWGPIWHKNSKKLPISQFFWRFHTFFHTFFKKYFQNLIRPFKCSRNIYGLHRFSIRNSSKLAISHLFSRFHTFFSHLQISNLDHNNHLNKCYKTI